MSTPIPPRKTMCATCPFRAGSSLAALRDDLAEQSLKNGSRICHSTGQSVIHGATGKPEKICRGARNIQLKHFHALKVIQEPTDASWEAAYQKLQKAKPCLK